MTDIAKHCILGDDIDTSQAVTLNFKGITTQHDVDTTTLQETLSKLNLGDHDSFSQLLNLSEKRRIDTMKTDDKIQTVNSDIEITCQQLETLTVQDKEHTNNTDDIKINLVECPDNSPGNEANATDATKWEHTDNTDVKSTDIEAPAKDKECNPVDHVKEDLQSLPNECPTNDEDTQSEVNTEPEVETKDMESKAIALEEVAPKVLDEVDKEPTEVDAPHEDSFRNIWENEKGDGLLKTNEITSKPDEVVKETDETELVANANTKTDTRKDGEKDPDNTPNNEPTNNTDDTEVCKSVKKEEEEPSTQSDVDKITDDISKLQVEDGQEIDQKGRGPIGGIGTTTAGDDFDDFQPYLYDTTGEEMTNQHTIQMTQISSPPLAGIGEKRKRDTLPVNFMKFYRQHEEPEENGEEENLFDWVVDRVVEQGGVERNPPIAPILEGVLRNGIATPPMAPTAYTGGIVNNQTSPGLSQGLYPSAVSQYFGGQVMSPPDEISHSPPQLSPCMYTQPPPQVMQMIPPSSDPSSQYDYSGVSPDSNVYPSPSYSPHSEQYPPSNQSAVSQYLGANQSSNGSVIASSPGDAYSVASPYSDVFPQNGAPHDPLVNMLSPTSSQQVPSPESDTTPEFEQEMDFVDNFVAEQIQQEEKEKLDRVLMDVEDIIYHDNTRGLTRNVSDQRLEPTLDQPLDQRELAKYCQPDDAVEGATAKASVYDTPQSSPSDIGSSGDSTVGVSSPGSSGGHDSDGDSTKAVAGSTMSVSSPGSSIVSNISDKTRQKLKDKLANKKNGSTSSGEKQNSTSKAKQRGRPISKSGREDTPKTKSDLDKQALKKVLNQYRPIEPKLSTIRPSIIFASTCVPVITPNGVQMSIPKQAEDAKESAEKTRASRKVAQIPLSKLREIDDDGDTILSMGIMRGVYIVRALVDRLKRERIIDDLINTTNKEGQTPLLLSCITNQPPIVQVLLENGADPNLNAYRYNSSDTARHFYAPIHFLCERAQFNHDVLKVLLEHGRTDINKTNWRMETPLHVAIKNHGTSSAEKHHGMKDSRSTVKLLLDRGAHISFDKNPNDQNPLHYLAAGDLSRNPSDYLDFLRYVLHLIPDADNRKELLQQKSDKGTVLHMVAAKKFDNAKEKQVILDALKFLIEQCGVDPTIKDKSDFPVKRNIYKQDQEISDYLTTKIKAANRHRNNIAQKNAVAQQPLPGTVQVISVPVTTVHVPTTGITPAFNSQGQILNSAQIPVTNPGTLLGSQFQLQNAPRQQMQGPSTNVQFQIANNPLAQLPAEYQVLNNPGPGAIGRFQTVNQPHWQPAFTIGAPIAPAQTVVTTQPCLFVVPQQTMGGFQR